MDGRRKCHSIFFFFPLKFSALCPFTVKTALRHLTCVVLLVPPQDAKNKIISYFSLSRIECVCTYLSDAIEFFKFTSISSSMSAKLWKNRHLHMLRTNLESLTLSRFWDGSSSVILITYYCTMINFRYSYFAS